MTEEKKFDRDYFVKQGLKGGLKLKKMKPKNYYSKIRKGKLKKGAVDKLKK